MLNTAEISSKLKERLADLNKKFDLSEVGKVISVGDGVVHATGLDNVQYGEMLQFSSGIKGMALNLDSDSVGIVLFGEDSKVKEGDEISRTGQISKLA